MSLIRETNEQVCKYVEKEKLETNVQVLRAP